MTKRKTHWLAVKVTFDQPITKSEARRLAQDSFKDVSRFPTAFTPGDPEQMWLQEFRSAIPQEAKP